MDTAKAVTATFDPNYKAKLMPDINYASIQDAYDNVLSVGEIRAQTYFFQEVGGLALGKISAKEITLKGGYVDDYSDAAITGLTSIRGPLTIQSGKLTVERVTIK
jgi:hypothetical protein